MPRKLFSQVDHYGFVILVHLIDVYYLLFFLLLSYYSGNRQDRGIGKTSTIGEKAQEKEQERKTGGRKTERKETKKSA